MEFWTYLIKKESSLYSWLYLLFLIYPKNMFIVLFSFEHQIVLVVSLNDYHLFWHSETRLNYKLSWDQNFLTLLCLVWYTRTQIFLGGPIRNDMWFPLRNFTLPISLLNFVGKKFFLPAGLYQMPDFRILWKFCALSTEQVSQGETGPWAWCYCSLI